MLIRLILTAALLLATGMVSAGEAGRIVFVAGDVQVARHAVALGDAVREGDELATGRDGYVYLKTVDNGFLILRPDSHARVVTYHIDAQNPANTRVKLELLSGVARAISGQGVKQAREHFRFNTPVAAIGVRGTDFTVFTDQKTSRVSVISGGVVVSGFSGACGPDGNGPCEGGGSRELFADQKGQMLEIQRGQAVPQLLRNAGSAADFGAPPRSDEPVSKAANANVRLAAGDVSLDPQRSDDVLANAKLPPAPSTPSIPAVPSVPATPAEPSVPAVPAVPVQPPVVVTPKPPEIIWGRWEAVAGLAPDAGTLAKLKSGTYTPVRYLGSFAVARVGNTELVLPRQGSASFSLVNSEAYIQPAGKAPVAAAVQNARLDVDFASRAFVTSMSVVGAGTHMDIHAQGDVTLKGELVGDMIRSNAGVSGYLGGADAREAAYVFKSTGSNTLSAFGAMGWTR